MNKKSFAKIISFAGGLPNSKFFSVKEIANASLNFSNSDEEKIEEGMKRLAKIIKKSLS